MPELWTCRLRSSSRQLASFICHLFQFEPVTCEFVRNSAVVIAMMHPNKPAVGWFRSVGEVTDSTTSPNMAAIRPASKAEVSDDRFRLLSFFVARRKYFHKSTNNM